MKHPLFRDEKTNLLLKLNYRKQQGCIDIPYICNIRLRPLNSLLSCLPEFRFTFFMLFSFIFFLTIPWFRIRNWHRFSNLSFFLLPSSQNEFTSTLSWLPEGQRACLSPLLYKSRSTVVVELILQMLEICFRNSN